MAAQGCAWRSTDQFCRFDPTHSTRKSHRAHRGRSPDIAMNQEPHVAARRRRADLIACETGIRVAKEVRQHGHSNAGPCRRSLILQIAAQDEVVVSRQALSQTCWGALSMLPS